MTALFLLLNNYYHHHCRLNPKWQRTLDLDRHRLDIAPTQLIDVQSMSIRGFYYLAYMLPCFLLRSGSVSIHMLLTEQYLEYPLAQSIRLTRPAWSGQVVSRGCNPGYIAHLLGTRMEYREYEVVGKIQMRIIPLKADVKPAWELCG